MTPVLGIVATAVALLAGPSLSEGLNQLLIEGPELHASPETRSLTESPPRHVPAGLIQWNPQLSADAAFIRAIAASGSQGQLGPEGIAAALYAIYAVEKELGFYGLEASSLADADRLETALRGIWAHNASLDRAQVHRAGKALVVVWTDGVPPEVWRAVNVGVSERLRGQHLSAGH